MPQLKKYVPASELRPSNRLQLSNGTCAAITSTRWLDTLVTVYNISVAEHHNYFAEGVLVHNADCGDVQVMISEEDFDYLNRKNLPPTIWGLIQRVKGKPIIRIQKDKLYLLLHLRESQGKKFNADILLKIPNINLVFSRRNFLAAIRDQLSVKEIKVFFGDMLVKRANKNDVVLKDLVEEFKDYGNPFLKPALVENWKTLYDKNKRILRKDLNALLDPTKAMKKNYMKENLAKIKKIAPKCKKCLEFYKNSTKIRDNIIDEAESADLYYQRNTKNVDWITFFGDYEAHHILPKDLIVSSAAMQFYLTHYKGKDIIEFNDLENGIMLKKYSSSMGLTDGVHANHSNYTRIIRNYLQELFQVPNIGFNDQQKALFLHKKIRLLVKSLKEVIISMCIGNKVKVDDLIQYQNFSDIFK